MSAPLPPDPQFDVTPHGPPPNAVRHFWRQAAVFVGVGLLIYAGIYLWSETTARDLAERNRFYNVQSVEGEHFDYVILGASHAAVFDYRDMNARLESLTGRRIINLATVGGGVGINRFVLDYFLEHASTDAVVYILDSFPFYSDEWNEVRMQDVELYRRAPFDSDLALRLLANPATRRTAVDYITGFSKINSQDRFEPDLFDAEGTTFDRSYRPIPQLDRQRMEYLYPPGTTAETLDDLPYWAEFVRLIDDVRARGIDFVIVRTPIPDRIVEMMPGEAEFSARVEELAREKGIELHDFTHVDNDRELFYDSDHLNAEGADRFIENRLAPLLRAER